MANARKKPAKPSTPASAGDLLTKATQDDIWAHAIYLEARKKLLRPVYAVVGLIVAFGFYEAVDLYLRLQKFATEQATVTINKGIENNVQTLINAAQPDLEKRLKEATDAAVAKVVSGTVAEITKNREAAEAAIAIARKESEAVIAKARESVANLTAESDAAAQRLKDIAQAGKPAVERTVAIAADCDPLALTADQIRLIAIRQQTHDTGRKGPNGRPIYSNSLTVDIKEAPGQAADSEALKSCILDAVDRVVFGLNPKWFNPDQVTRIDKSDQFRFAVDVWGITTINASVYLKGEKSPIVIKGAFIAQDNVNQLLVAGS
jgi:hypothetical protein